VVTLSRTEHDVVIDLPSIEAIQKQMYRRWAPFYASLVLKFVPLAVLCGFGIHGLIAWLYPERPAVSPLVLVMTFGIAALLICLWTLPAMLRLDFKISKALAHMAARINAGETVYATDIGASLERSRK
jgi:hypothetical protein